MLPLPSSPPLVGPLGQRRIGYGLICVSPVVFVAFWVFGLPPWPGWLLIALWSGSGFLSLTGMCLLLGSDLAFVAPRCLAHGAEGLFHCCFPNGLRRDKSIADRVLGLVLNHLEGAPPSRADAGATNDLSPLPLKPAASKTPATKQGPEHGAPRSLVSEPAEADVRRRG